MNRILKRTSAGLTALLMVFSSALAVPLSDVSWGVISVFAEGEQQTAPAMLNSSINFYNNRVEYNKLGYIFKNWVFDGTNEEATADAIKEKLAAQSNIILKPSYEKELVYFDVTVNLSGIDGEPIVYENREKGKMFTVTAPEAPEGKKFTCWQNASGQILSYNSSYTVMVFSDTNLTACYADAQTDIDAQPVIVLGSPYAVDTGSEKKVSCAAARSVPEGYTVIKAGMLYARNSVLSDDAFELDNDGVGEYVAKSKTQEGVVTLNVKVDNEDVKVSFRGYMVLKDNESGTTATYYTDLVEVRYSELV